MTTAPPQEFNWNALSAIATSLAAAFAAVAAWQSKLQVTAAQKAMELSAHAIQIQVFENIHRDIQEKEHAFHREIPADAEAKAHRDRLFFNTVNYLAFLLDSKVLNKPEFLNYYSDAFCYWWQLFEKEVMQEDRDDPGKYTEFKRICSQIKSPPPSFTTVD